VIQDLVEANVRDSLADYKEEDLISHIRESLKCFVTCIIKAITIMHYLLEKQFFTSAFTEMLFMEFIRH